MNDPLARHYLLRGVWRLFQLLHDGEWTSEKGEFGFSGFPCGCGAPHLHFAQKLNISRQALHRLLKGVSIPSPRLTARLIDLLEREFELGSIEEFTSLEFLMLQSGMFLLNASWFDPKKKEVIGISTGDSLLFCDPDRGKEFALQVVKGAFVQLLEGLHHQYELMAEGEGIDLQSEEFDVDEPGVDGSGEAGA